MLGSPHHPDVPLPLPSSSSYGDHTASAEPTPLHLLPPSPSEQQQPLPRERKNGAKKKCLYNFQDAFLEANKVVMATSASTASVSCTATTVQSSNNHIQVSSKRPNSLGKTEEEERSLGLARWHTATFQYPY